MVQLLTPTDPLFHKLRTSSFRCTPLTRRRTLPTTRDLTFSHSWRQNAVERAAVRKLTGHLSHISSLPKLAPSISLPEVTLTNPITATPAGVSAQAEEILPEEIPGTPATPLESQEHYPKPETQPEPKANIFDNTRSSEALLDLTMAALHRIYVDDYSDAAWPTESQSQVPVPAVQVTSWPQSRAASFDSYEQSPPPFCGSSVSSTVSTPSSSLPTPHTFSPAFDPEIACAYQTESTRSFPSKAYTASASAAGFNTAKPLARTHSAPANTRPVQGPTLGDKGTLRWFLVELLRRSRASASVVQLALHYLAQARAPVGDILRQRFKSETRQGQQDGNGQGQEEDSPLLDPRRLLLAAVMLSTKLLHDHAPNNRAWARVCGLAPRDVGACERALGKALDWKLASMLVGPCDEEPALVV